MARDARHPEGFARPAVPLSSVVVSGDLVYTSGQVAFDAEGTLVPGGLEEQTAQVFENLRAFLAAAGCTLDDVVKVNAYLTDLGHFETFNHVYGTVLRALSRADDRRRCPGRRSARRGRRGRAHPRSSVT